MNIYEKIALVQDEVQNITKDSSNPHFGNTYATYEQVMGVLHPVLRKHNLMVFHGFDKPLFEGQMAVKTTIVSMEEDGLAELSETLYLPVTKLDPQQAGSAITYAKRYMVLAMFGLGTEDDDGNQGSGRTSPHNQPKASQVGNTMVGKASNVPASPKQINAIMVMSKKVGREISLEEAEKLDMAKASQLIDQMNKELA